jgi:hypothetical protein
MSKDLTNSGIARQNILNNRYALQEIQTVVGIKGILFENEYRFTKKQLAEFFEVSYRTIESYTQKNKAELSKNGYEVLAGNRLKNIKLVIEKQFDPEMDFGIKIRQLSIYNFRAFLNIGMLLTDSLKARELRSAILDIVIDTIDCVDMGNFKYIVYSNKIYVSIFKENADEYRKILSLEKDVNERHTMYSEVLDLISSYEAGFAEVLKTKSEEINRKLKSEEVDRLFMAFENQRLWEPLREKARQKMASRDLCFRDALHKNLEEYVDAVSEEDFERFLGEKSMTLDERLEEFKEVFKRLKERE